MHNYMLYKYLYIDIHTLHIKALGDALVRLPGRATRLRREGLSTSSIVIIISYYCCYDSYYDHYNIIISIVLFRGT